MDDNIYAPHRGLSILAKELTATTHVMQSSSYELSTLVSGKAKCKQAKATTWCLIIPKLTSFNRSLKCPACLATLMSCDITKQSICGWQYIYIYIYIFHWTSSGEPSSPLRWSSFVTIGTTRSDVLFKVYLVTPSSLRWTLVTRLSCDCWLFLTNYLFACRYHLPLM